MMTFTLQATLIASIPVNAETCADAKRKLCEALASSRLHIRMLDDDPIMLAVEIEGDLDWLGVVECTDSISTPTHGPGASASPAAPDYPEPPDWRATSKESVFDGDGNASIGADRKTRRAALGALAAASALVIPAIGSLAPAFGDPVFAAIARHKGAYDAALALSFAVDDAIYRSDGREVLQAEWDAYERAKENEDGAFDRLLTAAPETSAGMGAIIAHLIDLDDGRLSEKMRRLLGLLLRSRVLAS